MLIPVFTVRSFFVGVGWWWFWVLLVVFEGVGSGIRGQVGDGAAGYEVINVVGTGKAGYAGDGGPAVLAQLNNPFGVVVGPDGCLYICDTGNHVVRRVGKDGILSTVAGSNVAGYGGDGGLATKALLNEPYEVRFDREGNLFFVEMKNHVVRKVDGVSGVISTVAGTGRAGFSGDGGLGTLAELNQPHSIQFDPQGDLYICDIGNHRIRKVGMKSGRIQTFAGTGKKRNPEDGVRWENAPLYGPRAMDFDREGNLWLALREGNAVYKLDLRLGTLRHIAGTGEKGFTGNGGLAKEARLSGPKGLALDREGNIFLADTESHSIRKVDMRSGKVELIAGTGERGDGPEGAGGLCRMARPHGVYVDGAGVIYVGDSEAHRVRVIRRR